MKGTRWPEVTRECLGNIHRELRITFSRTPRPEKWVFVAGCYNSGTTLLRSILGSHPSVSALPSEGQYLTDQFPTDHEIGLSRMWVKREDLYRLTENDTGPDANRIKKEWGIRLDKSKPVFLDQTPAHSARMRWLQSNFENSYFIGVIRNGYAAAEGIVRKAHPIHRPEGWSLKEAAHQWVRSNEIMQEDSRYLNRFILCRYEDIADNPIKEIARLLDFLEISDIGLDLSKPWNVHERSQVIQNMNSESIARLSQHDLDSITRIIEKKMTELGYKIPA